MKTYRSNQINYVYAIIAIFLILTVNFVIRQGFEIEPIITEVFTFIFLILIVRRIRVTVTDEYIESANIFSLKKRRTNYTEIKFVEIGTFNRFYTKQPIPVIILLDKKRNVLDNLFYKAFREEDIKEIIKNIIVKNKRVIVSEETNFMK